MRRKHVFLAIASMLAAGGLWLAWATWRADGFDNSGMGAGLKPASVQSRPWNQSVNVETDLNELGPGVEDGGKTQLRRSKPGEMLDRPARLAPPNPNRRFQDLTPEERVQRARRGPIGG